VWLIGPAFRQGRAPGVIRDGHTGFICREMVGVSRIVLLSADPTMLRLLTLNLERRGLDVEAYAWAACCGFGQAPRMVAADVLVADLHCPAPACWDAARRLRAAYARVPLLLLAHEQASPTYLQTHQPCECLQKPFGVTDALRSVNFLMRSGR
jgi:DNA-binding response OmpR family regulator